MAVGANSSGPSIEGRWVSADSIEALQQLAASLAT